jgi:hypothetical protein
MRLNEGWVRWTGSLATLGFAVTILDNYWSIVATPMRAIAYVRGTAELRAALTMPYSAQFIDLQGWLGDGGVGLWILVCSMLALRGRVWPRSLAYLGAVGAFAYYLALASNVIPGYKELSLIASAAAVVLGPVFYAWIGLELRRHAAQIGSERASQGDNPWLSAMPGG